MGLKFKKLHCCQEEESASHPTCLCLSKTSAPMGSSQCGLGVLWFASGSESRCWLAGGVSTPGLSCLRGEQLPMESLLKLPKLGKSVGSIGQSTATSATRIPILTSSHPVNEQCSSQPLPPGYRPGLTVEEIKSAFKWSRKRSWPSPRPANWLENKVPSTKVRENTYRCRVTLRCDM